MNGRIKGEARGERVCPLRGVTHHLARPGKRPSGIGKGR